ncbi:MAG: hypothetical protein ABR508_07115, partial [Candidatus Baltobacteraceae bacterium]
CVSLASQAALFQAAVQHGSDDVVCLHVEGDLKRPQRCAPLREVDMVSLIERAVFGTSGQAVFLESLRMAGRLLQHLS